MKTGLQISAIKASGKNKDRETNFVHGGVLKTNGFNLIFLFLIIAVFGYGVVRLFCLRFEAGDIYPPYSSLRSDPLGTRIFFDSLELIDTVNAERNYTPLSRYKPDSDTTLFIQGVSDLSVFSEFNAGLISGLVAGGGRLVFTFSPIRREGSPEKAETSDDEITGWSGYSKTLGVSYGFGAADGRAVRRNEAASALLPRTLPWRSSLYFSDQGSVWSVVYTCNDYPVVIERKFGRGRIIMISDTYCLSNEAMAKRRFTGFPSWIVGDNGTVVFDESHLGVYKSPGIAQLARKYGLHGFVFGLALLTALFVWKSASPLIPPVKSDGALKNQHFAAGSDNVRGLVNLLRRSVPIQDALKVCLAEWKKTCNPEPGVETMKQLDQIARDSDAGRSRNIDPAAGYNAIVSLVSKRKRK